jgi:hypothetical protein
MVHYETFRSNQLMAIKGSVNSPLMESPISNSAGPIPAKVFPPFA